jgi:hypothetical protein
MCGTTTILVIREFQQSVMQVMNMHYLYGSKRDGERRLVATFSSEQQLLAYVRWATLESTGDHAGKFEQGSVLVGYLRWEHSAQPLTDEDASSALHNPTPSML